MESTYNIIFAVWLTTWVMVQWRVFMPAAWLIFGIGSFMTVPVMLLPCLNDEYRDIFVKGYVNNLLKIEL